MKKLHPLARKIIGDHVYDALAKLGASEKKVARLITKCLAMVMDHAKNKEINFTQLFVKEVICGKHKRFKMIRYGGRAKTGHMKKETSRIKIILEVKPLEDVYRLIANGECPAGLAYLARQKLLDEEADYERVRKYQFLLTAKGRQQKKLMMKRKVAMLKRQFRVRFWNSVVCFISCFR